ncbi:MAG: hypothetical protein HY304_08035 [candidate division Zixibacteria bacterium]|nr:hypothetical protein [candidate division Zixibacteria bacterium]
MRKKPVGLVVIVAALVAGAVSLAPGQDKAGTAAVKTPNIQGTYMLVSRDLPNGAVQKPPAIVGMVTYTEKYRNFNVAWSDSAGKHVSISYVAEYTLTDKEYVEKNLYFCMNDEITGTGLKYDFTQANGKAPVTTDGSKLKIKLPLHDEPEIVFEGSKLTATRPGVFVDHWEKVR